MGKTTSYALFLAKLQEWKNEEAAVQSIQPVEPAVSQPAKLKGKFCNVVGPNPYGEVVIRTVEKIEGRMTRSMNRKVIALVSRDSYIKKNKTQEVQKMILSKVCHFKIFFLFFFFSNLMINNSVSA